MEKMVKLQKKKRKRKHGFFARMKGRTGENVIKRRRLKKRKRLTL